MHWRKKLSQITQKKLSCKEIVILYSMLGVIILGSFYHLKNMGYTPNMLILKNVISRGDEAHIGKQLFHKWMYTLTGIEWSKPTLALMNITPYRQQIYSKQVACGEIKGYFEQDENTHFTQGDLDVYIPQVPTITSMQDYLKFKDKSYVYSHYFTAPAKMEFGLDMLEKWDFYDLVTRPIAIDPQIEGPKILIFHTHSREAYIGGLTVVDVAEALADTLEKEYNIEVLHVTDSFYEDDNKSAYPTGGEYERMEPTIRSVLEAHPSISVVIDLHRDGVNENVHLVTEIEGKQAAKIMFVNGLCLNRNIMGEVEEKVGLSNPYIGDNLAFSLQSMVYMNQQYPGLARKIYLNEWRYSTHMKPYSLLLEWGAQTNTSEEAMNAVGPVAEILAKVLQKD